MSLCSSKIFHSLIIHTTVPVRDILLISNCISLLVLYPPVMELITITLQRHKYFSVNAMFGEATSIINNHTMAFQASTTLIKISSNPFESSHVSQTSQYSSGSTRENTSLTVNLDMNSRLMMEKSG